MPLAGDLRQTSLADVLRPLATGLCTGTLTVQRGHIQARILFRNGSIHSSSSNDPRQSLARFLMRDGALTEDQLFEAHLVQQAEGRLVGSVLVGNGTLTEEQLQDILTTKIEETIYDLFLWPEGHFEFHEEELPADIKVGVTKNVDDVLHEGARRIHSWVRIRQSFPHLMRTTFRVVRQPELQNPRDMLALSLASAGRSLAEIIVATYCTEYEIAELFLGLHARGIVAVGPVAPERAAQLNVKEIQALIAQADALLAAGDFDAAIAQYERALSFDSLNVFAKKGARDAQQLRARAGGGRPTPAQPARVPAVAGPAPIVVPTPPSIVAAKAPPVPSAAKAPAAARGGPGWPLIAGVAAGLAVAGGAGYFFVVMQQRPPMLESLTPVTAKAGESVSLAGARFALVPEQNSVLFGDKPAVVAAASANNLVVTVPAELKGRSPVPVVVSTASGRSEVLSFTPAPSPEVTGIEPDAAMPGELVSVQGRDLDLSAPTVSIGSLAVKVQDISESSFRVRVPDLSYVPERKVDVTVRLQAHAPRSFPLVLARLPEVKTVMPVRGSAGERVTIQGRGFAPDASGNLVTFGGQPALVLVAKPSEIVVSAPAPPAGAAAAEAQVVVQTTGRPPSVPVAFSLTRPQTDAWLPRFFPVPVPEHATHDHVAVSSELGALVLLVSGKGDAATTAERAHGIAMALNAMLAETGPIELGDAAGALPRPHQEDAAAYAESWGTTLRDQQPSTEDVGAYWVALVSDYRTLFAQGERPAKLLAITPRADVLGEIHDRIVRARKPGASNATVPVRAVLPLPADLQRRLRDLALLVPAGAATGGPAGLAGTWEGTATDAGGGVANLELRLHLDGAKLAGTAQTRGGSGTSEASLEQVVWSDGELRFTLGPRAFAGGVKAESMAGTIRGNGGSSGRFALRLADAARPSGR